MAILTEDSVEDAVPGIRVRDALKPELEWSEECHEEREEELSIRQDKAEATGDEEEELDEHREDSPVRKLVEDDLGSAMRQGSRA